MDCGKKTSFNSRFWSTSAIMHMNNLDLQRLGYGARLHMDLNFLDNHLTFHFPFSGRIWLLVDENTFFEAALFAFVAKNIGFATVVGEQTGGSIPLARTAISMPNTGIIATWHTAYLTDEKGRAFAEGVRPQYTNRLGLDALETVLAMIGESGY